MCECLKGRSRQRMSIYTSVRPAGLSYLLAENLQSSAGQIYKFTHKSYICICGKKCCESRVRIMFLSGYVRRGTTSRRSRNMWCCCCGDALRCRDVHTAVSYEERERDAKFSKTALCCTLRHQQRLLFPRRSDIAARREAVRSECTLPPNNPTTARK